MNKLTKLSIRKFRNVAPTTLEFSPGLNVLLGRNATGKTTLLRLLSNVVGSQDEALKSDELDMSYRVTSPSLGFEHTIKRMHVDEPVLGFDPGRSVREELSALRQTDSLLIERNGKPVLRAEVLPREVVLERAEGSTRIEQPLMVDPIFSLALALSRENPDTAHLGLATELMSAQIRGATRMDESLDRFHKLLSLEVKREAPQSGLMWLSNEIPQSMHSVLSGPVPDNTSLLFSLAFLTRAAHMLGYDSASARFDVERISPESGRPTVRLSNLRFFFKRSGEEVSHNLLSYGQKRLLSFFAHVDASPEVVIADELVNGLHHEWISACLNEIGDRQAFLTSQNPLLLDFLRFNSAEDVRRTFILCERASTEAGAQLVWRNPTVDEAESFYSAYETGIQRISDILLTKGLW